MNAAAASRALRLARWLRLGATAATAALIALVAWWVVGSAGISTGVSAAAITLAIMLTLPLWVALPRLATGHRRTYAWMTLAVVPYLALAITEAIANPQARAWAGLCLFTGFALFVLLIACLRVTRSAP